MSKRLTEREKLLLKLDRLSDREFEEVLEYVSNIESKRRSSAAGLSLELQTNEDIRDDDLLANLITQRENQRARQVFEWETARRGAEAGIMGTGIMGNSTGR